MKSLSFYLVLTISLISAFIIGIFLPERYDNNQIYHEELETTTTSVFEETTTVEFTTTIDTEEIVMEEEIITETNKALTIWLIMKSYGWNDYMCAGILGNILAECAGNNIEAIDEFALNGTGHYGLCQWSIERRKPNEYEILSAEATLEEQMEFLKWELMLKYSSVFYNLMNCTNEQKAAEIFWKGYEKSNSIGRRCENATDVYFAFSK